MNTVTLYGRVTKDIELEETKKSCYARFTIAVNDGVNADGEKLTQFIPCIAWKDLAENLSEYVRKGDRLVVRGKIDNQAYEDKDGNTRWSFQVVVQAADFVETKSESEEKEEKDEKPSRRSDKRKR